MAILAKNLLAGEYGVPGYGVIPGGATREIPLGVAAQLAFNPEFELTFTDPNELAFRGEDGRVRYLGYLGPIDSRFGYGGGGILIMRALSLLGIQVSVNPRYTKPGEEAYEGDLPPEVAAQIGRRSFIPRVEIMHCPPQRFHLRSAPIGIGYTMWETDRIPEEGNAYGGPWLPKIHQYCDLVIVPCPHNKEVFEACGVKVPIEVIPYGLDIDVWPFFERPERDTFTVVQFGDLTSRKGVIEAIEAFQRAFPREQDVRLVFKTKQGRFAMGPFGIPKFRDTRISVINEVWSRGQLVKWLHNADCFIWLSRGEGFGLPPLQAALTGMPVVMTTHSGMGAYYRPQFFYGVRSPYMSESSMGGRWYDADIDHAAEQLRKVYEDRKGALARAKKAATYVRNNFSIEAFADRLGAYLERL